MDEIRIQVIFKADTPYGVYQDALWFTEDEYTALTSEVLEAMKQERVDKWIEMVTNPPVVPELTPEERIAQIQTEINDLFVRIQNLEAEKTLLG